MHECHHEHAPECRYSAENHGMVATHIQCAHMCICVGCKYCSKKSWSGHTWGDHFKTIHSEISGDDHYGPPLDLAGVKLEEASVTDMQ